MTGRVWIGNLHKLLWLADSPAAWYSCQHRAQLLFQRDPLSGKGCCAQRVAESPDTSMSAKEPCIPTQLAFEQSLLKPRDFVTLTLCHRDRPSEPEQLDILRQNECCAKANT